MSTDPAIAEALAAEQRVMLRELAEIGMQLARELPAKARADNADGQGLSLAFTRLSRAIRLTLVLEARTLKPAAPAASAPERDLPSWEARGLTRAQWDAKITQDSNRSQTYDLIEKAIACEYDDREQERLTVALYERLDDGRDEEAFASEAPVAQVVMAICRDLGLDPDWADLDEDDWDPISDKTKWQLRTGKYKDVPATGDGEPRPPPRPPPGWMS